MSCILLIAGILGGIWAFINVAVWILMPLFGTDYDLSGVTVRVGGHTDPRTGEFHGSVFDPTQPEPVVTSNDSCPVCIKNKADELARAAGPKAKESDL